jgi:hypothetical protein
VNDTAPRKCGCVTILRRQRWSNHFRPVHEPRPEAEVPRGEHHDKDRANYFLGRRTSDEIATVEWFVHEVYE